MRASLRLLPVLLGQSAAQSLRAHDAAFQNATTLEDSLQSLSSRMQWQTIAIGGALALLLTTLGVSLKVWLNSRESPPFMQISEETAALIESLQETREVNEVRNKFDFKMQRRLKWLLGNRTAGQLTTLARSRLSSDIKLAFELTVMIGILYYVDLTLDIQACITFWQTDNPKFLLTNVMAMVAAAMYTAYHIFTHGDMLLSDLSRNETFLLGVAYVFQMHIIYLCWISWKRGKKHQLLIDSKFAEAAIEAVVSSLVQTYAVIFGAGTLSHYQQTTLYLSILGSLASISNAFTLFDSPSGIDQAPGNVTSPVSARLLLVNGFRLCELTNKITGLSLFQLAFRPYGGCIAAAASYVALTVSIWLSGGQASFGLPCVFALINPMLETHNAVTMPHVVYYSLRAAETLVMLSLVWFVADVDVYTLYQDCIPAVAAFAVSCVGMICLLPLVRCLASPGVTNPKVYTTAEWVRKPFSTAQCKLRDAVLSGPKYEEVVDIMLQPARQVMEVAHNINRTNLDAFMEEVNEPPVVQSLSPPPPAFMTKALHVMGNAPLEADPKLRHGLLNFALQNLQEHPTLMTRIFMETRAIDAASRLILAECSITSAGLQVQLPREMCQLFLSASSTLLRQNDTAGLQRLQTSQLARALAAVSLEQSLELQLQKELVVALACLYCAEPPQRSNISDLRLRSVFSGAMEDGSLELLCAVPRLFDSLSATDPAVRTCFQVSACYLAPYLCEMLDRLDAERTKKEAVRPQEGYEPLLSGNNSPGRELTVSGEDVVNTSIESLLRCLLLAVQNLDSAGVSSCSYCLQRFVQKGLQSDDDSRKGIAQKVQLLIGAKGLLQQLEAAGADWNKVPEGLERPLLQVAVESGSLPAVNFLLSQRADVTQRSSTGYSAFHVALSVGDAESLEALQTSMEVPSLPADGALFAGSRGSRSDDGPDLERHTASSRSGGAVSVRLGLWTRARGPPFYLRLRRGQLVATVLSGEEVWCCDPTVEIGGQTELRWSSWDKAQERWGQGTEGPLRMVLQVKAKDLLLILGEEMAYFSHWNSEGYEGQALFDGVRVLFDGSGDRTRRDQLDYINVYSREALMDGQQYYEFKVRKVVCNMYLGLIEPGALQVKGDSLDSNKFDRWCLRFKPQYHRNEIMTGKRKKQLKQTLQPHSNVVGMLVDMTKRAVLFLLNGEVLGDPICDLPETLYLFATLDTEGDHFELSQPAPPREAVDQMMKLSACGEVRSWLCDDCLCTYSRLQNSSQVNRWVCRRTGTNICEGCRLGIGNLPNGYCGLSLSAWRDSGVLAVNEDTASVMGFQLMLSKQMCWSRGQLIESAFLAALANHGNFLLQLLRRMSENMQTDVPITFVGRFNLPGLLTKPSIEEVAKMALMVSVFAARPLAVDAALVFLQSLDAKEEAGLERGRTRSGASLLSSAYSEEESGRPGRLQAGHHPPWFQNVGLPTLLCALRSYCATGRQLQRHAHALYPASAAESGCSTCPRASAEYASDTGDFFQCHQCFHLSERPPPSQQEDCSAVISRLLQENPSCLDDRLASEIKMAPQVGDLMIGEDGADFLSLPVYRVEKDKQGQGLALVPLNVAQAVESGVEGLESGMTMGPSRSDWDVASETSGSDAMDFFDDEDDEMDGVPSLDEAQPLWSFSRGCTALHLAAALPSPKFLKQLLAAHEMRDDGQESSSSDVSQTISKQDRSWSSEVRQQIDIWLRDGVLSEGEKTRRIGLFDAQNVMVRWPPDRAPMPQSRFPLTLICRGDHWLSRRCDDGQTAVHIAALANQTAQLQLLLDARADPTAQDNNGFTPLMLALKIRGEDAAFRLIGHIEECRPQAINVQDLESCTALHYAVYAGNIAATVVKRLLEAKANPMPANKNGKNPLMLAVQQGASSASVAEVFLQPGPWSEEVSQKLDDKDKSGHSAIMMVVQQNLEELAKLLLAAGAKVDDADTDKRSPLEMVKKEGMMKILCSGRTEPSLQSARGGSVLKWLLEAKNGQALANALRESVSLSRLVEAGRGSSSVHELEILLHWTAEDAKTMSEEDREAMFQEVLAGTTGQDVLSQVLVYTTERDSSHISVATFLLKQGARVQDVIAQAIKHKRVALVSSLLNVAALARETHEEEGQEGQEGSPGRASEKEENDEGDVGLELLSEVLDRAVGEVRDMEADLSAKEMLVVLGKVVYGAEQWAKVDARIKSLHPVSQPPEYKKFVLKGFQDLAEKKREQEAKKQQRRKQHARLDSDYEDMLDLCSDEEDDFSPTVTGAVTEVDTAGVTTTVTK